MRPLFLLLYRVEFREYVPYVKRLISFLFSFVHTHDRDVNLILFNLMPNFGCHVSQIDRKCKETSSKGPRAADASWAFLLMVKTVPGHFC